MTDRELIDHYGGAAKVAALLNMKHSRVSNWKDRGIPSKVKLDHPEMFLAKPNARATSNAA